MECGDFCHPLGQSAEEVDVICFSADGGKLFAGVGNRIRGLDATSGRLLHEWDTSEPKISPLAASPDGKWLASGAAYASGQIRIWNADSGAPVAALNGHGQWLSSLAFSRDGRILVSAGADQTVRIYSKSGRPSRNAHL